MAPRRQARSPNTASPATKVRLITGSARGLGLAAARRFAERGDRVHVVYRSSARSLDELEREFPGRVHHADLERAGDWRTLIDAVIEGDGKLDTFVHAVGEYVYGPASAASASDLRRMLCSNVESAFLGMEAVRPHLRASRGVAVYFGCAGLEGLRARSTTAAYTAAKSALVVLARSWAVEEAAHGVRINVLSPGFAPHEHASPDTLDRAAWSSIPLGRPAAPREIVDALEWLCSDTASYVTGVNLDVAGGWMS
jgi:NAD(P)-dependent dehydrogenase (short-subunit alcohol dehydrogenase family)